MCKCAFCNSKGEIGARIIYPNTVNDKDWYAFVPKDPAIFGHIIVTVKKPHIREIVSEDAKTNVKINEALQRMMIGVKTISDNIRYKIDNVERVYHSMLGESDVHMHYHLIPKYNFNNYSEREKWAEKYQLGKGSFSWRFFYAYPTRGFGFPDGFQYMGEIEKHINIKKDEFGEPSKEIVEEMAGKIRELFFKKGN